MLIRRFFSSFTVCISLATLISCSDSTTKPANNNTSISNTLRNLYYWVENNDTVATLEFPMLMNDSLFTGLDRPLFAKHLQRLEDAGLFTATFVANYKAIGDKLDWQLQHDTVKYHRGEINFGFEDALPWNHFQDDFGNYWDSLKINNLTADSNIATVRWTIQDEPAKEGYFVRLKKENNSWKIDSLEGFDLKYF